MMTRKPVQVQDDEKEEVEGEDLNIASMLVKDITRTSTGLSPVTQLIYISCHFFPTDVSSLNAAVLSSGEFWLFAGVPEGRSLLMQLRASDPAYLGRGPIP